MATAAITRKPTTATNGNVMSTAYSTPPSTGPTIDASCQVAERRTMSHGSTDGVTMSPGSARVAGAASARATPKSRIRPKIGVTDVGSVLAYHAIPAAATASPKMLTAATVRRSRRSAMEPLTSTSSAAGANSASPSSPRSSSLLVMS